MPKNPAAVALGKLGGKATAARIAAKGLTEDQRKARSANAKKATADRVAKRKAKKENI